MSFFENSRIHSYILFLFAILLYANTIFHAFVLDDIVVISENAYVQEGVKGISDIFSHDTFAGYKRAGEGASVLTGGRYRPLSLAFFAILHSLFGNNTIFYHGFAILLFALSSLLLYHTLRLMLKATAYGKVIALATTILFIAHPIHTEVVANAKSADELLAFLLGIGSLFALFRAFDSGQLKWKIGSGILLLFACLAKENAITFVITGPLALWYFRNVRLAAIWKYAWPIVCGAILFLVIRHDVLGDQVAGRVMHDPLNNPFLEWNGQAWVPCSVMTKVATILYTFGDYVRLMIIPYPLTHDYYPMHIRLQSFAAPAVIGSLCALVLMIVYSLRTLKGKIKTGYGLLFFLGTLSITANIFFPVGTFMAERFLFLPSLGLILSFTIWLIGSFWKKKQNGVLIGLGLITLIFSFLTIVRNKDWKTNETLLKSGFEHSPNSIKSRNDWGTALLNKALVEQDTTQRKMLLEESLLNLKIALDMHPTYYDAYLAYGACAYYLGQYDRSVETYRRAMQLFAGDVNSKRALGYALQAYGRDQWTQGDTTIAISALTEAWTIQPDTTTAKDLSYYYKAIGQKDKAEEWLQKSGIK